MLFFQIELAKCNDKYIFGRPVYLANFEGNKVDELVNFQDANKYYSYVMNKLLELKNMIKTDNYPFYSIQTILLQIARCEWGDV